MTGCIVACIQLTSGDDVHANIAAIDHLVREAHAAGAEFILLPENAFCMDAPGGAKSENIFTAATHPGIAFAETLARELGCWLLIGSLALKEGDGGKRLNRSLLISSEGITVAHYDKIHLFDVTLPGGESYEESARILPGDRAVLAKTPWGNLGMTVCYDVRFPQLYRHLAQAGAGFLAVPAAFTAVTGAAHWHVLLRARAIENGCYVFAPAQCGTHPGGRKTYGHALIVDPWGTVLADAGVGVGFITAAVDPKLISDIRARIPSLQHDRTFKGA